MVLSCPNCDARFNLGNIQVEHVRCPVCYSIWKIEESKLDQIDSYDAIENLLEKPSPAFVKKINKAEKTLHYLVQFICLLLILYSGYCLHLYYKHCLYCENQIKIKELRCTITEGQLQLRCQIHNVAEKQILINKADLCISEETNKEIKSMWVELKLLPYSSTYFTINIPLQSGRNFTNSANFTIRLR